eukprot:9138329-Pyramimonas_sp.AAC.1
MPRPRHSGMTLSLWISLRVFCESRYRSRLSRDSCRTHASATACSTWSPGSAFLTRPLGSTRPIC